MRRTLFILTLSLGITTFSLHAMQASTARIITGATAVGSSCLTYAVWHAHTPQYDPIAQCIGTAADKTDVVQQRQRTCKTFVVGSALTLTVGIACLRSTPAGRIYRARVLLERSTMQPRTTVHDYLLDHTKIMTVRSLLHKIDADCADDEQQRTECHELLRETHQHAHAIITKMKNL